VLAFFSHTLLFQTLAQRGGAISYPTTQYLEIYHYFVGSKYFAELGHDGLYEATVIADYEDDPGGFVADAYVRDLRTNVVDLRRSDIVAEKERVKARFSDERWRAFKRDIAIFRTVGGKFWRSSRIQTDRGYNATPFTTLLLGSIANQPFVDSATFIRFFARFDLLLVLGLGLIVARQLGRAFALSFLLLWLMNPLNDYAYIGGAYLRYNHLIALALAILALQSGRSVAAGVWLAVSAHLRAFPVAFIAAQVGQQLSRRDGLRQLWSGRRLYVAYAIAGALLMGASALVTTPSGESSWSAFVERMSLHSGTASPNRVGWQFPFMYSSAHSTLALRAMDLGADEGGFWVRASERTFDERKVFYYATTAMLLGLAAFCLRRMTQAEAPFVGILLVFTLLFVAHYYYALLALIPLIFPKDRRVLLAFAGFCAVAGLIEASPWLSLRLDLKYVIYSLAVGALLVGVAAWRLWGDPEAAEA
jgi:hypothetical protein